MNKYLKTICTTGLILLASVYLTFIVDVYTLNTWLKRIFVFCYFVVASCAVLYVRNKFLAYKKRAGSINFYPVAALLGVVVLFCAQTFFLPTAQEQHITITALPTEEMGTYGEIWLTQVAVDGKDIPLSEVTVTQSNGWTYAAEYDDYVFYPDENADNRLEFEAAAECIELTFGKNAWSGSVEVFNGLQEPVVMELFSDGGDSEKEICTVTGSRQYSVWERAIYNAGAAVVLMALIEIVLSFIYRKRNREIKKIKMTPAQWGIAILAGILFLATFLCFEPELYTKGEPYIVQVTTLNEKNSDCRGYEAEVYAKINGTLSSAVKQKDDGWQPADDIVYYCTSPGESITYEFDSRDENEIILKKHPYAAMVAVEYDGVKNIYDCYAEEIEEEVISLPQVAVLKSEATIAGVIVAMIALFCAVVRGFYTILGNVAVSAVMTAMLCFCWGIFSDKEFERIYCGVFCAFLLAGLYLYKNNGRKIQKYFESKVSIALIIIVSGWTAFSLIGYELFLKEDFWDMHPSRWILFLNAWILTSFAVCAFLEIFERIYQRKSKVRNGKLSPKAFYAVAFFAVFALTAMSCVIFYPANMTSDGTDQWLQASGALALADAHPVIHTLFIRLCYMIYPNPVTMTIAQAAFLAAVVSAYLTLFYKRGVCMWPLLAGGSIFAVLPNTIVMVTCTTKNTIFTILMMWVLYLLVVLLDSQGKALRKLSFLFQMVISVAFLYLIRHNTFVILPVVIGIFLYLTIKFFKNTGIRPVICLVLSVLVIQGITGPMYTAMDVTKFGSEPGPTRATIRPLVAPLVVALKFDVPLSEETEEYLERIMPLEEFEKRYEPYNGDVMAFTDPIMDCSRITLEEAMKHYLEFLRERPDIVIKSRLDGANILWDVFSHPGVKHDRYALGIWGSEVLQPYMEEDPTVFIPERAGSEGSYNYTIGSGAAEILAGYLAIFDDNPLMDSLLWRNGIYLIMAMIACIFALRNKQYRILALHAVPFAVFGTLMLVMDWNIYQYIWFYPVCTVLLLSVMLTGKTDYKEEKLDERQDEGTDYHSGL